MPQLFTPKEFYELQFNEILGALRFQVKTHLKTLREGSTLGEEAIKNLMPVIEGLSILNSRPDIINISETYHDDESHIAVWVKTEPNPRLEVLDSYAYICESIEYNDIIKTSLRDAGRAVLLTNKDFVIVSEMGLEDLVSYPRPDDWNQKGPESPFYPSSTIWKSKKKKEKVKKEK